MPEKTKPGGTKILLGAVIIFGIAALIFGVYSLRQKLVSPFTLAVQKDIFADLVPEEDDERLNELREQDSDEDGLSDYEEIYIYDTSAYIADTDSDGVSDSDEITLGTNPNCPTGTNCQGIRVIGPNTTISDLFPEFSDSNVSLKDRTLQEFRAILLADGFDEDRLAEIDDETLLIILEESVKIQEETISGDVPSGDTNLDEVRLLLIELGVPEDEVFSLSDQDVRDILNSFE